jgi:ribonuclease-3 family protein
MRLNFNPALIEAIELPVTLSPSALAYLGDAVFELYIRTYYLSPPKRLQDYHRQVVDLVRAEKQADFLDLLAADLTPEEQEVVRRGRNAVSKTPRRLDPATYRQATSLEALIGYLYLHNPQRLNDLLAKLNLD